MSFFKKKTVTLCLVETPTKLGSLTEREVLCVSLKKDPKLGLGKMINACVFLMLFVIAFFIFL